MGDKAIETVEDLPGVGPATAEKLKDAGYNDLLAIAVESPERLADQIEIAVGTANKIINAARKAVDIGDFETGDIIFERRKAVAKLTSCSKALDDLLGGGFETQAVTELYGEFGCGKTQMAHQLAVNVQLPIDNRGLEGHAAIIDTEGTFRPERIVQMADALGLDPKEVLQNIHVARAYSSSHQMLLVDKIKELASDYPIRLIVVDSLTAHFRAEYVGRGLLADRQGKLNIFLHSLRRLGEICNAVVLVTNQVHAKPDALFGDPTRPIGGHVVGHTVTFRIYMRKGKGDKRVCKLVDSPCYPEGDAVISIKESGIRD